MIVSRLSSKTIDLSTMKPLEKYSLDKTRVRESKSYFRTNLWTCKPKISPTTSNYSSLFASTLISWAIVKSWVWKKSPIKLVHRVKISRSLIPWRDTRVCTIASETKAGTRRTKNPMKVTSLTHRSNRIWIVSIKGQINLLSRAPLIRRIISPKKVVKNLKIWLKMRMNNPLIKSRSRFNSSRD